MNKKKCYKCGHSLESRTNNSIERFCPQCWLQEEYPIGSKVSIKYHKIEDYESKIGTVVTSTCSIHPINDIWIRWDDEDGPVVGYPHCLVKIVRKGFLKEVAYE